MSLVDPRYEAGELVGKYIFYSHLDFNGLFRLNIETKENEFICHFDDDYSIKKKHNKSFIKDNYIYFLPGYGNYIDIVNCETLKIKRIELNRYKSYGAITAAFACFDDKLMICPFFVSPSELELPFYQIDLGTLEVNERWDINDKVREECNHVGETCLWYGGVYGAEAYAVIIKSEKVVRIDLKNNLVNRINTSIEDLYGVSAYESDLWLISRAGALYKWNNRKVTCIREQCGDRKIRYIEKQGEKLLLIPEYDDSIEFIEKESDREKVKLYCKVFEINNSLFRTFSWYRFKSNILYLFSDRYCSLVKVDYQNGSTEIKKFGGKTIWPNADTEQKCMRNIMTTTFYESDYYQLTDFCNDILKY